MKRYLLFAFDVPYEYALGGWNDFQGDFDSLREAKDKAITLIDEFMACHIVDGNKKEIIFNCSFHDKREAKQLLKD